MLKGWFFKKKTEDKPPLKPDYVELLLDIAQRVETLEKHVAKLHIKQSPGRPQTVGQQPINTPQPVVVIDGKAYNTSPSK